jgi:iron complex outermembrane recepter protein
MFGKITPVAAGVLAALYGTVSVADDNTLQEVIVTATRRSESAQDIPASITAITGKTLDQAGISDTADLARSLAGINVTDKAVFQFAIAGS